MQTHPFSLTSTTTLFLRTQRGINRSSRCWAHLCRLHTHLSLTWGNFYSYTAKNYTALNTFPGSHCLPTQGVLCGIIILQLFIGVKYIWKLLHLMLKRPSSLQDFKDALISWHALGISKGGTYAAFPKLVNHWSVFIEHRLGLTFCERHFGKCRTD